MGREFRRKITRGIVKMWMRHRLLMIVAIVAIIIDIVGVCVIVRYTKPADNIAVPEEVAGNEVAPVANVDNYSHIFGGEGSSKKKSTSKVVSTVKEDGTVVEEEAPTVLEYNASTRPGYMNNCYFLGDSRTVAMVSYGFISDSHVLAKVGISHTSVESTTFMQNSGKQYTVKQYLQSVKPPVVYICYGVNGMNGISEEKYEKTYTELVEHIIDMAPDSKIVLMSIWPVDDNGRYKGSVKNEWINTYNDFLLALAEYEGIYYLNVSSVLTDPNGSIKREFDSGDGLHYKASAYNTIIDYIMHHPVKGISDEGEFKVHYVKPSGEFKTVMTEKPKLPDNVVETQEPQAPEIVPTPTPTVGVTEAVAPPPAPALPSPSLSPSPIAKTTEAVTTAVTPEVKPTEPPAPTETPTEPPAPTDPPTEAVTAEATKEADPTEPPAPTDPPSDDTGGTGSEGGSGNNNNTTAP